MVLISLHLEKQIEDETYDQTENLNSKFSAYLWSPQAMFDGKIRSYFDLHQSMENANYRRR